jgi:hypothetical protein
MHETLRFGRKLRNMVEVDSETGTVYLNSAVVPRVRMLKPKEEVASGSDITPIAARHFVIAEVCGSLVTSASNVWVGQRGPRAAYEIIAHQSLLEREESGENERWVKRRIWRGFEGAWESVASRRQEVCHGEGSNGHVRTTGYMVVQQ